MKRITALLLAAFLLLALAACTDEKKTADATADATAGTSGEPAEETGENQTGGTGFMQIANPWSEAETLAEAAEKAKVGTFVAPVVAGGTGTQIFRWMDLPKRRFSMPTARASSSARASRPRAAIFPAITTSMPPAGRRPWTAKRSPAPAPPRAASASPPGPPITITASPATA